MNEEKKLALLIDSDNVSAKYAQFILQEAGKYGELTYKRIYGDWEKGGNGWHYPALNNSIMPVQQTCYISGKNATDFSMIIDAMDILYTGDVDGFVLVTSDSDFTRLAIRLREAGKLVVGIGEVKTPLAFTSSCHHFSYLNQVCEPAVSYDENTIRKTVLDYVRENDDGRLDLLKISGYLTSKFGSIDFDSLGYNRFSGFIDSFPELKRTNTFVTLKKKAGSPVSSVRTQNAPSESEIVNVIVEYLRRKGGGQEDLCRIEQYITGVFGKIDFSRFGSKRLARFIDNQPQLSRMNNVVALAVKDETDSRNRDNAAVTETAGNNPPQQKSVKATEADDKKAAPSKNSAVKITREAFIEDVRSYAAENMPNGGNLGQLNNMLMEKYGKTYISDLGYDDFATAVLSVTAVKVASNHVFANSKRGRKPKLTNTPVLTDNTAAKAEAKTIDTVENAEAEETQSEELPQAEEQYGKPDLNLVKREIQTRAAQSKNGIPLTKLGKILKGSFGEDYLKQLGFRSLKSLLGGVAGVTLKLGILYIDEDFAKRTEEIEQYVYDIVRSKGKCSVKALTVGIRKKFESFDFTDYGYSKFIDFINAIDGVKATRYYVEAE